MSGRALRWAVRDRPAYDGPLLLDTHIWVWMLEGLLDESGGAPGLAALLTRSAAASRLCVSDISCWEVAQKCAKGKLAFAVPPAVWLSQAEEAPGIHYLSVNRSVLVVSSQLNGAHGDPADRILIASAKLYRIPLVTMDRRIIEFAEEEGRTPVCDGRR